MSWKAVGYMAAGALGVALLGAAGGAAFVASGRYDIAAMHPHLPPVRTALKYLQRRAIIHHARDIPTPRLDDPAMVRRGLALYREHCVVCHGAPGESRERAGIGLNPTPPPLDQAIERWTPAELYWTTAYGLKMAGMPSFLLGRSPGEIWAMVAFMRQMNRLSPDEYRRLAAAVADTGAMRVAEMADTGATGVADREAADTASAGELRWVGPTRLEAIAQGRGDAERGKALLVEFGCTSCHRIPGLTAPYGEVGPPLERWAERQYISGRLVNTPAALAAWIVNPQAVQPGTAMPVLGVSAAQAGDMAAYLYTLGELEGGVERSGSFP